MQTLRLEPTQVPPWQLSLCVQMSPSLHGLKLQVLVAGTHVPVQVPIEQTNGHGEPVFWNTPAALQVCGCRPVQVFAPGTHTPVHAPIDGVQTNGQAAPVFWNTPAALQVCGCRPVQVVVPGLHEAVQVKVVGEQISPPQSLLVQQFADGMQEVPHCFEPVLQAYEHRWLLQVAVELAIARQSARLLQRLVVVKADSAD